MYRKYGKTLLDMVDISDGFIRSNDSWMAGEKAISMNYRKQPPRERCKICESPLPDLETYFISHEVEYKMCGKCGHLNGVHDDTVEFSGVYNDYYANMKYTENSKKAFLKDVHIKYEPKAKFLVDSLNLLKEDPYNMKCLDIGAGCGHMVYAACMMGLRAEGVDMSLHGVSFGNRVIREAYGADDKLRHVSFEQSFDELVATDANIVMFINVLEHIQGLRETLSLVAKNKKIGYIFFDVPMFSLSNVFEIVFQNQYNRQLGGSHTHLFTKSSLDWIYGEYGFTPVAVWDFGSEILDLRRFLALELRNKGAGEALVNRVLEYFVDNGDEIQLAIDRSDFASGTIVLCKT